MKAILVMPKSLMILALSLVALSSGHFLIILLAVSTALISDFIFTRVRKVPLFLMSAAIVSGLIIGLLVSDPLGVVAAAILAMLIKNFVRVADQHIFNPAAAGLLIVSLLMGTNVSWWGVSWQQSFIPVLILLTPALVSIFYMKRWKIILPFLIIYAFLNKTYFDPTVIFFATVMLPEPQTSPNDTGKQIIYGSLVALGANFIAFADPLIASLLFGNLLFFFFGTFNLSKFCPK